MATKGYATFGNYRTIGGYFSVSQGAYPGQGVLVTPANSTVAQEATLTLIFGAVRINFPGSRVTESNYFYRDGLRLMRHHIQDGRWKLAQATVSGKYNQKGPSGKIPAARKRPIEELFGEISFQTGVPIDVSGVSDFEDFIPVDWDQTNAAAAIESLCASTGVSFNVTASGGYRIDKAGVGANLPVAPSMTNAGRTMANDAPKNIRIVGAPTQIQTMFTMRAVGLDKVGSDDDEDAWMGIDGLSYAPSSPDYWSKESPESFAGIEQPGRNLALKTVFRCYQIKDWHPRPFSGFDPDDITNIKQVLPIQDRLLVDGTDFLLQLDRQSPKATIHGVFSSGNLLMENTSMDKEIFSGFSINEDLGIITFDRPVYKLEDDRVVEAELFLQCTYTPIHYNREADRIKVERQVNPAGLGTEVVQRKDIQSIIVQPLQYNAGGTGRPESWTPMGLQDNFTEMEAKAERSIDILAEQHRIAKDVEYPGFLAITPAGKIQRVRWDWGHGEVATTRASSGYDFDFYSPRAKDREQTMLNASLKEML